MFINRDQTMNKTNNNNKRKKLQLKDSFRILKSLWLFKSEICFLSLTLLSSFLFFINSDHFYNHRYVYIRVLTPTDWNALRKSLKQLPLLPQIELPDHLSLHFLNFSLSLSLPSLRLNFLLRVSNTHSDTNTHTYTRDFECPLLSIIPASI